MQRHGEKRMKNNLKFGRGVAAQFGFGFGLRLL